MGQKDIISKKIFKRILVDVATTIFKLDLTTVELIETEQQRVENRQADLCARVKDRAGKAFILHIEIQNRNQSDMPDRMLRYLSDIRINYPGEEVIQYLLYIGKAVLAMPDNIHSAQLQYRYNMIDMHDMDYHFFINQNTPDAIIMAVLCDINDRDSKAVIHEILTKLQALTQNDSKQLREYLGMLEILSSNRNINLDIQQEFEMLQIEIEKLPSFVMGEKKGIAKGMEKGIAAGERKKALLIAKQLMDMKIEKEKIAQVTGLELGDLDALEQ